MRSVFVFLLLMTVASLKASRMDGYCGVSLADCEYQPFNLRTSNNCNSDGSTDFSIFHIITNGCNIDVKQTEVFIGLNFWSGLRDLRSYLSEYDV
uniref:Uncharacterized protein n=1 Tax=Maylandia zebra TaxID=106582 RepID=A0A3P9C994_9CICH